MIDAPSPHRSLTFMGPFGWTSREGVRSIFEHPEGQASGLYLWTVAAGSAERVYYVGETGRSFSQRLLEHLKEHLSGSYHVYEPVAFADGTKIEVWPGLYGPPPRPTINEWLNRLPSLSDPIMGLVTTYRFFLATADWETRLRQRAEAAIAVALASSELNFQDANVRYRPRRNNEEAFPLEICCARQLLGLPTRLIA